MKHYGTRHKILHRLNHYVRVFLKLAVQKLYSDHLWSRAAKKLWAFLETQLEDVRRHDRKWRNSACSCLLKSMPDDDDFSGTNELPLVCQLSDYRRKHRHCCEWRLASGHGGRPQFEHRSSGTSRQSNASRTTSTNHLRSAHLTQPRLLPACCAYTSPRSLAYLAKVARCMQRKVAIKMWKMRVAQCFKAAARHISKSSQEYAHLHSRQSHFRPPAALKSSPIAWRQCAQSGNRRLASPSRRNPSLPSPADNSHETRSDLPGNLKLPSQRPHHHGPTSISL